MGMCTCFYYPHTSRIYLNSHCCSKNLFVQCRIQTNTECVITFDPSRYRAASDRRPSRELGNQSLVLRFRDTYRRTFGVIYGRITQRLHSLENRARVCRGMCPRKKSNCILSASRSIIATGAEILSLKKRRRKKNIYLSRQR